MLRALKYFIIEAGASLWRGWQSALLAVLTIAAGLFVLGFFLVVNTNMRAVVDRWSEAAEMSIYVTDGASPEQRRAIEELVERSGLSASREYISKAEAAARFKQDFPDLAAVADQLQSNPFPASVEVRLLPEAQEAGDAVDRLAASLGGTPGVADVRYDRRWLSRLNAAIGFARGVGILIVAMLAVAAALTVANVVRLAAYGRRDEIEIMQLVGAPLAYVRGPFVFEGILQGGIGAVLAIVLLWALFVAGRARFGGMASEALGLPRLAFLPPEQWLLLVIGGMLLGCLGAFVVARKVR
jgi:cell division transport system permease protein